MAEILIPPLKFDIKKQQAKLKVQKAKTKSHLISHMIKFLIKL